MSVFRQTFLNDSINRLTVLENEVKKDFSENLRREAFRTIHTIKGGAQTFDLPQTAQIADELENTLSTGAALESKNLILEGIDVLLNFLRTNEPAASENFLKKLRRTAKKTSVSEILFINLPHEVFKNLSAQERAAIVLALGDEKDIFCVEAGFDVLRFAEDYRNLQQILNEKSEVLASLPSEKYKSAGKIGFRIFFASRESVENLRIALKNFDAEVSVFEQNDSGDLREMFGQIVAHGERIAEKSGKEIRFAIFSNGVMTDREQLSEFFEILLHLVRNAADHAIEKSGCVEIIFFDEKGKLHLSVADDGSGIDLEKVRVRAVAKNLISDDDLLNDNEIIELIFAPEFSTAEKVTEISGRGVGLDAVKSAVEKINGKISAHNRKSKGAIFEIVVPKEKDMNQKDTKGTKL